MERITIKFPNGTEVQAESATPQEVQSLANPSDVPTYRASLDEHDQYRIVERILGGKRDNCILAIKFRRAITGSGLREAKQWFDNCFPANNS